MTTMTPPYLEDIRAQPDALERLLSHRLAPSVRDLMGRIGQFDRVILTGMGSSLFACRPTFLRLAAAGIPVWSVETAELLGPAAGLLTPNSLVWMVSQSGNSAEVVALLDRLPSPRPVVLGTTDDGAGTLAGAADVVLELHSGPESTVSTKSYLNTLTALALATDAALGVPADASLARAPAELDAYLLGWDERLAEIESAVRTATLFLVGRGSSMAAVNTGALIIKEAAKQPVEGLSVPQFRHGPLDMAGPEVTVVVLAGGPTDHALNRSMVDDLTAAGSPSVWLDVSSSFPGPTLPDLPGPSSRALAEMLPLQLLSVVLARRAGLEPGAFHRIAKVTQQL